MDGLAQTIFSTNFVFMWIRVATPIIFPALGAVICTKAGVVNLGLEGFMLCSALVGVITGYLGGGLFWGMLGGIGISLLLSLVFAYFHLNLKANPVLCGTAINSFASGFTVFLLTVVTGQKGTSAALKSYSFPAVDIPVIKDIPILGEILSGHNLVTYLAFIAAALVYFIMYKTALGLRIQSVGENPNAAMSVGVNVTKVRYIAIVMCGVLCGFGGMYLSMGYLNVFSREMTAGRGFIALAACTMGQVTPWGALLAAIAFALLDAFSNVLQVIRIPTEFIQMMPYLATIAGLVVYSIQQKKKNSNRRLAPAGMR